MFFKKKNYTIKPNFSGPACDPKLMLVALATQIAPSEESKSAFIAGVLTHWVFDEDAQEFLPSKKGLEWLNKRIKSGDGDTLAKEIRQAFEMSLAADNDTANQLFDLE